MCIRDRQKGVSVPAEMENLTELFDSPFGRGEEGITINGLVWMGTDVYKRQILNVWLLGLVVPMFCCLWHSTCGSFR